jgi:hypothetical protein
MFDMNPSGSSRNMSWLSSRLLLPLLLIICLLTISIKCNSLSIIFAPATQRAEISEDVQVGTRFHQMRLWLPEQQSPTTLSFRIVSVSAIDQKGVPISPADPRMPVISNFFAIERITGEVIVHTKINRDIAAVVSLNVSVADVSLNPPQVIFGTLVITITDYNDHPPSFGLPWTPEKPEIAVSIQEEQPVGTVLLNLIASDQDSDISHYEISPPSQYFAINNETGVVTIKQVIDYETIVNESPVELDFRTPKMPNQIRFNVIAYDSGVPQLSAMAVVHVTVININDNEPVFNQSSYRAVIKENTAAGTFVAQVKAIDADYGKYGKITYNIVSISGNEIDAHNVKDFFTVSNDTGIIRVGPGAVIDRETGPRKLTVQVGATDDADADAEGRAKRMIFVPVYITVEDVNDNAPKFLKREYQATTLGHADGPSVRVPVIQVSATDEDEGEFGQVTYKITDGNLNGVFEIDSKSGLISVQKPPIDVNPETSEYDLKIEARDELGFGPFADETRVKVKIIQVNRHKPKFLFPSQPTIDFYENQKAGTKVLTVQAFDEDQGSNGVVRFAFQVDGIGNTLETDEFLINPDSGLIVSKKPLDRESQDRYHLVLVAKDYLGEPQSFETLQQLTILIRDVDDNKPEFTRTPASEETYVFSISENQNRGSVVGQVTAIDRDHEEENRRIYYHILDGNMDGLFYLDKQSGFLYANVSFDREQQDLYELVIKASPDPNLTHYVIPEDADNGNVIEQSGRGGPVSIRERSYNSEDLSLAYVIVRIKDVNDNKPIFKKAVYRTGISFSADIDSPAARVLAYDPDAGINGSLSYQIRSIDLYRKGYDAPDSPVRPIPSPFGFAPDDYEVRTLQLMSQYPIGSRFVLLIEAKEKSTPFRTAQTKLNIWIYDPAKLIRITIKLKPEIVNQRRDEIEEILSLATDNRVIMTEMKHHYDHRDNRIIKDWSDVNILVVDERTYSEVAPQRVIAKLDSSLRLHSERPIQIEKIALASAAIVIDDDYDSTTLIFFALVSLICVGFVTMGIAFCCLKSWYHQKLLNDTRKAAAKAKALSIKEREAARESILRLSEIRSTAGDHDGGNDRKTLTKSNDKRSQSARSPTM